MKGKRVLITGATNGIGMQAALELMKMGADVVIVGRDAIKTRVVSSDLKALSGSSRIDMLVADLSSMDEIRRIADEFRANFDRLDVLLNNAGAVFSQYQRSVDGYEMTFALNHLSYYLLTRLLLDILMRTANEQGEARIINVSSSAHRSATLRLDNLHDESGYSFMNSYGASKLMNVQFTYELARWLEDMPLTVNAVHPGLVATGFGHSTGRVWSGFIKLAQKLFGISPQKGAETLVYLASSAEVAGISGKYWNEKQQKRSSDNSYDREQQKRLWEFSAKATGLGKPALLED
ncbi:MAG: SDR family NAD(P)-dependent oxidoreductase [Chloroflexi bacterium]|nr:SDR family NAD(P)-dependent oxidoreductase [Chloroflexota bacterium]